MKHKPVFKKTHFECSDCGKLWRLDATFEMMDLQPCTKKTDDGMTFDPHTLEQKGDALIKAWRKEQGGAQ